MDKNPVEDIPAASAVRAAGPSCACGLTAGEERRACRRVAGWGANTVRAFDYPSAARVPTRTGGAEPLRAAIVTPVGGGGAGSKTCAHFPTESVRGPRLRRGCLKPAPPAYAVRTGAGKNRPYGSQLQPQCYTLGRTDGEAAFAGAAVAVHSEHDRGLSGAPADCPPAQIRPGNCRSRAPRHDTRAGMRRGTARCGLRRDTLSAPAFPDTGPALPRKSPALRRVRLPRGVDTEFRFQAAARAAARDRPGSVYKAGSGLRRAAGRMLQRAEIYPAQPAADGLGLRGRVRRVQELPLNAQQAFLLVRYHVSAAKLALVGELVRVLRSHEGIGRQVGGQNVRK